MIDFATLQGLTIPEGVVTQIADASGRVLWMLSGGKAILEVEKITSNTYAGETTYTGEQFILLDIYPKTNGTVKVTYGGLTKTITDTSGAVNPNAQQVVFGTFNGVVHDNSPESGRLTIEGDYNAFACGQYKTSKVLTGVVCSCVTSIKSFGIATYIPKNAFGHIAMMNANSPKLKNVVISKDIVSIGASAFTRCGKLTTVKILATNPPVLGDDTVFDTADGGAELVSSLTAIIVPKGCGNAYRTAEYWSEYADYIVEAS